MSPRLTLVTAGRVLRQVRHDPRTIGLLVAAAALARAFVVIERRVERPLVPPHTWRVTTLVSGTTVMLGVTGLLVGAIFLSSVFLQTVLGLSALGTGLWPSLDVLPERERARSGVAIRPWETTW